MYTMRPNVNNFDTLVLAASKNVLNIALPSGCRRLFELIYKLKSAEFVCERVHGPFVWMVEESFTRETKKVMVYDLSSSETWMVIDHAIICHQQSNETGFNLFKTKNGFLAKTRVLGKIM